MKRSNPDIRHQRFHVSLPWWRARPGLRISPILELGTVCPTGCVRETLLSLWRRHPLPAEGSASLSSWWAMFLSEVWENRKAEPACPKQPFRKYSQSTVSRSGFSEAVLVRISGTAGPDPRGDLRNPGLDPDPNLTSRNFIGCVGGTWTAFPSLISARYELVRLSDACLTASTEPLMLQLRWRMQPEPPGAALIPADL